MKSNAPTIVPVDHLFRILAEAGKTLSFQKYQTIFAIGDCSDSIFFIQSGSVKLTVTSETGREAVIAVLGRHQFFGESSLATAQLPRSTNAVALNDVRVTRISRDSILNLIHTRRICEDIISCLVALLAERNEELANNLLYDSEKRLARALLSMSQWAPEGEYHRVPHLSQQDLANMVGITRQRVNVLLNRFKRLGYVDNFGGLRVHRSIMSATGKDLVRKSEA